MKKKYNLLVTIMVAFLLVVVLSWIIPGSSYYSGSFTKGDVVALGLTDLFKIPLWTFSTIFQFSLIFLTIGGLYGVMNKTGVYSEFVSKIVKKFKKKSHIFLIITVLTLSILSSVMGGNMYLFILVPFFASVLLSLGYSKCATLLSTVGALFAGTIGSTYSFEINGYINYYLRLDLSTGIIFKLLLFIFAVVLLILFVLKFTKKQEKIEDIPLLKDVDNKKKKKSIPLIVIFILGLVLCLVGTFSFQDMYGIEFFNDIHTALMEASIGGYKIFANLLGSLSAIGSWSIQSVNVMIIIMSLVIGWIYSVKIKDLVDSFIEGAKEMLPTFIYATFANIILVILMNSSTGSFINYTLMNTFLTIGNGLEALGYGFATLINSFFVNYFPYLSSDVITAALVHYQDATIYPVLGIITQAIYGLMMYIFPTSLLLIAGLSYLNVSYKEWFKYIWRYLLCLLALIIIIIVIMLLV